MKKLLSPFTKGKFELKNHLVMAPMTRSRAIDNLPNQLMETYYGQRTGAGLIVTEGTAPAPEALGYPRMPGIFSQQQVDGWKPITAKVHQDGTKIFVQLMHSGRIGHTDNLPKGVSLVGATDLKAVGQIFTDTKGLQDFSSPVPVSKDGIKKVVDDFVSASKNATEAGFDGVEIHGANGYLLEQFLNPNVNTRTDEYGGSIENRSRFTLEVVQAVASAIGRDKVGIRFSPFSKLGDLKPYDEDDTTATYAWLAQNLNALKIAYVHIAVNAPIPEKAFQAIRDNFFGTIILSNGQTPETAEKALDAGFADLVAFGRSFLSNPDFVERIESGEALNPVDYDRLYTPGPAGYIDYPVIKSLTFQDIDQSEIYQ
ncbi:MAG TPA: alkene reductase [Chitinophagaceae bacterium]|jgi:N-ethylmaleimide reductase|nr:alkene reductase [Chitinophagaceae bacterium]